MSKLIIKNIGYDFGQENLKKLKDLSPYERLGLLFVLPNYQQLEKIRLDFARELGGMFLDNIVTFDDLIDKYFENKMRTISREQGAWIIKKILEGRNDSKISNSLGTSKEIYSLILDLKSRHLSPRGIKAFINKEDILFEINEIYKDYEEFLDENNLEDEVGLYIKSNIVKKLPENIIISGFIDFRPQELTAIKKILKQGVNITIQYPFMSHYENRIFEKTINSLKDLGFEIVREVENKQSIAMDLFSKEKNIYEKNVTLLMASNPYYEVREVLFYIEDLLISGQDVEDISIIITDEYEDIIKNVSEEVGIKINLLKEQRVTDITLVKSIVNLLDLIRTPDKKKLISYLFDSNYNEDFSKDKELILETIRTLDYKGIFFDYELEGPPLEFINKIRTIIKDFNQDPKKVLKEIFAKNYLHNLIISHYRKHKNNLVLSENLKGLKILENSLDELFNFYNLIELSPEDTLEILIESILGDTYYTNSNEAGIQVFKSINSLGSKSKYRFLLGMNYNYPQKSREGLLSKVRYKEVLLNLNIDINNNQDELDNEILKFADIVGNSENLFLSYTTNDIGLKDNFSIFVKDLKSRISNINNLEVYSYIGSNFIDRSRSASRFVKDILTSNKNNIDINYYDFENLSQINEKFSSHYKRYTKDLSFWGKINSYKDQLNSTYSPKMIQTYRDCPFKFYLYYVLKYKSKDLEYQDEFSKNKGNFYHEVLEKFFKTEGYLDFNDEEITSRIQEILEHVPYNGKILDKLSSEFTILNKYLLNYIKEDIKEQKTLNTIFKPSLFEHNLSKSIKDISLWGRTDRIDLDSLSNSIIYDYKSKNSPSISSVKSLEELQLPLYALMYCKDKFRGLRYGLIEKEDKNLVSPILSNKIGTKGEEDDYLEEYFSQLEEILVEIDRNIKEGVFIVKPLNKNKCTYCEYSNICRKEEVRDGF